MEQLAIGLTGVIAIWLTQQNNQELKRYACIFGLAAQPFWFYTTWKAEQWGIFGLSFIYTFNWALGFRNNWL